MDKWIDVVTDPLGLSGFALCLVFLLLTRLRKARSAPWVMPVFVGMAFLALVGGIWLASEDQNSIGTHGNDQRDSDYQETHGDFSPAIKGVEGNVTITIQNEEKVEDKISQ